MGHRGSADHRRPHPRRRPDLADGLGGDDEAGALAAQPAPDDLFGTPDGGQAAPDGVHVRGVEEGDARLRGSVEDRVRGRLVRLQPKGHRSHHDARDGQAGIAEGGRLHRGAPPVRGRSCAISQRETGVFNEGRGGGHGSSRAGRRRVRPPFPPSPVGVAGKLERALRPPRARGQATVAATVGFARALSHRKDHTGAPRSACSGVDQGRVPAGCTRPARRSGDTSTGGRTNYGSQDRSLGSLPELARGHAMTGYDAATEDPIFCAILSV
jgi:hypothetical protein